MLDTRLRRGYRVWSLVCNGSLNVEVLNWDLFQYWSGLQLEINE